MHKTMVSVDRDLYERIKPYLKRQGLTFSSFVRKSMADFVELQDKIHVSKEKARVYFDNV